MTNSIHVYGVSSRRGRRGVRRTKRRRGWLVVLLVLLVLTAAVWWTTRDTSPMGRYVPEGQDYQVFIAGLLEHRDLIVASRLWDLLPEESEYRSVRNNLRNNFGVPDWVLNNVMRGHCFVSGRDLEQFSDPVVATRMTWIGCLAEKFHVFVPWVEGDAAGGLRLRHVPDADLYYAVRGRLLLMSPSREALVRTVTLREEEALGEAALAEALGATGGAPLAGEIGLSPADTLGEVFESVRFAVRLAPESAELALDGRLRPQWQARLAGLVNTAAEGRLMAPPPGLVAVSGNFGAPLGVVWKGLDTALGPEINLAGLTAQLAAGAEHSDLAPALELAAPLFAGLGPKWAVSWVNVDQQAMVPMPEFVALAQGSPVALREAFTALPEPPPDAYPWATFPRYDTTAEVVRVPMPAGPALEPTLGIYGNALLLSSSRPAAEKMLAKRANQQDLQRRGNLYVRVLPYPCLSAVAEAGRQFADFGLIRGHTAESFEALFAPWLARAEKIRDIHVLAALSEKALMLEAALELGEAP